jgi:hypothetical protein
MNQISVLYPEIDLLDEQGHSFIKLRQTDEMHISSISQTSALDLNSVSQFNNWLALTPSVGAAVASSNKQLMTCTFEYSKLVQAKDGSGAIGVVYKEGSNKFGAHGRFHEAKNLKSLVTTGLILNVASQVLAQKHLADINERLKSIDQQIKGIRQFLEQSRMIKIEAFQEHLQRVGMLLKEGEHVHTDTLHLLAQKSQEVRAQVIHIGRDLEDANKEINDFDSNSWFGSNDLRDALKNKIGRISHLQREYLIGLQCLLAANLILFIKHGGNKEFVIAGNSYLDELSGEHGLVEQWNVTKRRVNFHLSKMKPVFEWAKSTQANAYLVEAKVAEVQQRISQDTAKVHELQQQLVHAQNPRVLLELEGQQVVRGYYL